MDARKEYLKERLSKYVARCGVASRRKAESIIRDGRVAVNNAIVLEPFSQIDSHRDNVTLDGNYIFELSDHVYIALHKPRSFISDLADPRGRSLARDLIDISGRIYPVGRLDYESEGLIIFTNDGDFAQRTLHPRNGVEKEYLIKLRGTLSASEMAAFTEGRALEGVTYRVSSVALVSASSSHAWYRVIAKEGKNRMIRKLAMSVGHQVLRLRRVRIGPVLLGSLKEGQYRLLTSSEVRMIMGNS
jgi:23S rRNA pseudouridine2605 synthase